MTGEGVSVPKSGRFDQVYNTETAIYLPAYSIAEVVDGLRTEGGLRVRRPMGDSLKNVVVIGSAPVPPLSNGQMQANQYLRVLVTETTGETLAPGNQIGSENGQFGGKKDHTGFVIIEVPDAANPPFVAMAMRTGGSGGAADCEPNYFIVSSPTELACDGMGSALIAEWAFQLAATGCIDSGEFGWVYVEGTVYDEFAAPVDAVDIESSDENPNTGPPNFVVIATSGVDGTWSGKGRIILDATSPTPSYYVSFKAAGYAELKYYNTPGPLTGVDFVP